MLHHIAIISVCYGGHFESKIAAKIQKSSNLGEIWFPSRLWCCELISKSTCIVRLGDICNAVRYSNVTLWVLEPLISHAGILMTFYLSIILDLQNFFHWYILQSWKLKRPQIPLRPHHVWTYTSNLTTVVKSVLKYMINGTTSILKS